MSTRSVTLRLLVWSVAACSGAPPARDPGCTGEAVPIEGGQHIPYGTAVAYQHHPPSSGNHWACWAPWGVATSVLPEERWVHNLEHGGVALLFSCPDASSCPALGGPLAQVYADAPEAPTGGRRVVVTADPNLGPPFPDGGQPQVAASAWGYVYRAASVDEGNLLCFIRAHEGHGPEDIPDGPSPDCPAP